MRSYLRGGAMTAAVMISLVCPGIASAEPDGNRLVGEIRTTGIAASGRNNDGLEDLDRSGLGGEINFGWENQSSTKLFRLQGTSNYFHYAGSDRNDRVTNSAEGTFSWDAGKRTNLTFMADYTNHMVSIESSNVDRIRVRSRLRARRGPSRVEVGAGWRWHRYDGDKTHGSGPIVQLEYRYRLSERKFVEIETQYDAIDASVDRRDYKRVAVRPSFRFPLGENTRLEVGTRFRWWRYPGRRTHHEDQKDNSQALELAAQHDFPSGWRIDADAQYIRRRSNDDRHDENVKRFVISVRKAFSIPL
jgi:hypothetical protein